MKSLPVALSKDRIQDGLRPGKHMMPTWSWLRHPRIPQSLAGYAAPGDCTTWETDRFFGYAFSLTTASKVRPNTAALGQRTSQNPGSAEPGFLNLRTSDTSGSILSSSSSSKTGRYPNSTTTLHQISVVALILRTVIGQKACYGNGGVQTRKICPTRGAQVQ
jgi:hypothetical protein